MCGPWIDGQLEGGTPNVDAVEEHTDKVDPRLDKARTHRQTPRPNSVWRIRENFSHKVIVSKQQ